MQFPKAMFNFLIEKEEIRPEQFNFLFFEHLGQKLKIGGGNKNKNKSKCETLIRKVQPYNT